MSLLFIIWLVKKITKIILPAIVLGILLSVHFIECKSESKETIPEPDKLVTIRLSVVGDIMCHSPQFNYAKAGADSFDFNPVFSEVKKYFSQSDFLLGNFETVTAGSKKEYSGYPFFNTPDDFVPALKNAGFNIFTTANNHALDQGEHGVLRTIEILKKNNLLYNGTFNSARDRDSIRIYDVKGIKIAYLAYSYGTNGNPIPKGKNYLINLIDYDLIKRDITTARKNGAQLVLVHYHFGIEYKREPVESQKEAVEKAIEFGADIIIGGHPHVIEPLDYYKTKHAKLDTGFVAWSMGNFISNQQWRYSDVGMILSLELTKNLNKDSIYISNVFYTPAWVYKGIYQGKNSYKILPVTSTEIDSSYSFLTTTDKSKMIEAFRDTKEIVTKYTKNVKLYNLPKVK